MKTVFFSFFLLVSFLFVSSLAHASTQFPIPSLGNCRDEQECFYFCQIPQNAPLCWSYKTYIVDKNVLADQVSTQLPVSFPIKELGNCQSISECYAFCSKKENQDACTAFKQTHMVHTRQTQVDKNKVLSDAKTILGCNSQQECKAYCDNEDNKKKCISFAQQEGMAHERITPTPLPSTLFDVTKQTLGCDSLVSCKNVCSKIENYLKCAEFARSHNLLLSTSTSKPSSTSALPNVRSYPLQMNTSFQGGCQTNSQCQQFCKEHIGVCPGFPAPSSSASGSFFPSVTPSSIGYPLQNYQRGFPPSQTVPFTPQGSFLK